MTENERLAYEIFEKPRKFTLPSGRVVTKTMFAAACEGKISSREVAAIIKTLKEKHD